MIFVDTNYFLRFLLVDNEPQYSKVKGLFLQAARGHVKLATSTLGLEDCYHLAFCKTKGIVKIETFDEKLAKEFGRQ